MATTYTIRVINQSGAEKSYFAFMRPPAATSPGGETPIYTDVWATFDNIADGDRDTIVYTVEAAEAPCFVILEGAATQGEAIALPKPANFATVDFTDHPQTTADVTQHPDGSFSVVYDGLAERGAAMDIEINFINQSNDANNSQVVIFGDDSDTPVATHSMRVPPRTTVRVTHSSLPSGGRLEVSPPRLGGALFSSPGLNAPLAGCVVIDATTPDGYLDNARAGNFTACPVRNVADAVQYLKNCAKAASPGLASIVGHGGPGIIAVGGGSSPGLDQQLSLATIDRWTPQLSSLKGLLGGLALYGVQVGADEEGAELLFRIAQVINAPVYGPTGLIYCYAHGDFILEFGTQWQVATPTARPQPIASPTRPSILETPSAKA